LTLVKFIAVDRMLRNTFILKQNVYSNVKFSIIGGKGKDRDTLIKCLIKARVEEAKEEHAIKDLKEIGLSE